MRRTQQSTSQAGGTSRVRVNHRPLFWGLALVTAGAVALAVRQGLISQQAVGDAWRLWPLILVAMGISIIAARSPLAPLGTIVAALVLGLFAGGVLAVGPGMVANCGRNQADGGGSGSRDGTFGGQATVELHMNCGTLQVTTHSGDAWRLQTLSAANREPEIDASSSALTVTSADGGWLSTDQGRQRWDVTLPTNPALDLSVDANAGTSRLDIGKARLSGMSVSANAGELHANLAGSTVEGLDIEVNAGSASVMLDADSMVSGSMTADAGKLVLCAPASVPLQIQIEDNVAFRDNLEQSGLQHDGNTWESASYAGATRRTAITISGKAASFELNPTGGCS